MSEHDYRRRRFVKVGPFGSSWTPRPPGLVGNLFRVIFYGGIVVLMLYVIVEALLGHYPH